MAPLKEVRIKQQSDPWVNSELLELIEQRQGFFYRGGIAPPLNWSKSGICIRRHNSTRTI